MAKVGRVVVAGGTGFVGGEVVRTFQRLGYETFVISRKGVLNTAKTPALLTGGSASKWLCIYGKTLYTEFSENVALF